MSGHSKWSKIKHKKGAADAKRGKMFSKMSQQIAVAARDGGGDMDANFSLRLLVDKAKAASMPADNIKRAIDRGTGASGEAMILEQVSYEGFGPAGVAVIVETLTDNKNRTVTDVRGAFASGGNIGESGSVAWNFAHQGRVILRPAKMEKAEKFGADDVTVEVDKEEVMMALMEIEGVLDIQEYEDFPSEDSDDKVTFLSVICGAKDLAVVRDKVAALVYIMDSAELIWTANNKKEVSPEEVERVQKFIDGLEDIDDVQNVWTDIDHLLD